MILYNKSADRTFSLRKEALRIGGISPSLITQIIKGRRQITRDRIEPLAQILRLSKTERLLLDRRVSEIRAIKFKKTSPSTRPRALRSNADNSILADWLHLYLKNAALLPGFIENANWIRVNHLLPVTETRILRSLRFLVFHGFLRRNLVGKLIAQDEITQSTNGIANPKIRAFHKNALKIAALAIEQIPLSDRCAHTVLLTLNTSRANELRELLAEFYERLIQFLEESSNDPYSSDQKLIQVIINHCPISKKENHA